MENQQPATKPSFQDFLDYVKSQG
jgi:hypothetical protein